MVVKKTEEGQMAKNLLFPVTENGYDIDFVNEQIEKKNTEIKTKEMIIESLNIKIEKLTENNNSLKKERDELYENCVIFAKKIKKLESIYCKKEHKVSFEIVKPSTVFDIIGNASVDDDGVVTDTVDNDVDFQDVPEEYTSVDFDELFNILSNADNETISYIDEFKNTVDNIVLCVRETATGLISKARNEHENIINNAKIDAQRIIDENKLAKEKLETAYKHLSDIFADAETRLV